MAEYDVIIVGGATHGLTVASYLAKAGLSVAVYERSSWWGGSAITKETTVPGFKMNPCATGEFYIHPQLSQELGLEEFGLEGIDCPVTLTTIFGDGEYMSIYPDPMKTAEEIARFSEHDAEVYLPWYKEWLNVGQMYSMYLTNYAVSYGQFASAMCASVEGERMLRNMLFGTITDALSVFENDHVKAAFLPLNEGSPLPPQYGPFFFNIARAFAPWGIIRGGIGKVGEAFHKCAEHWGVNLFSNSKVERILTNENGAYGVELADGTTATAKVCVVSTLEPNLTFGEDKLVPTDGLPEAFNRGLREIRYNNCGFTMNVALDGLPDFGVPEDRLHGFLGFCKPDIQYMENAYAYRNLKQLPKTGLCGIGFLPTVIEGETCELAPKGQHLHTAYVYPTYFGCDKQEALDLWVDTLEDFVPGYKSHVLGADGYSPTELEEMFQYRNGGEQHADFQWYNQMDLRPIPGYSKYETPVKDLYLAGPVCHPQSGLGGPGGRLVARKILEDHDIKMDFKNWTGEYVL